ncbi:YHS domain-containing (seleno)protein [Rhodopseudomonas palustris]|uniref:YHS domain-containing (seleno)protein n=1 Tax=Rhodopseudomonas palustris TaxID=1076 RepID=UPI000641AA1A|nr:YHS domain-containing (seleno)protein [Rhodopseudomonas palustris]
MTAQRQERNQMRLRIALIGLLSLGLIAAAFSPGVQAATTERVVADRNTGLAIDGFDPVAYFTDREPRQGQAQFEASASGVVWRFCNDDNRKFFLARPDIYGPQFGGYDPVAVARGVPLAGNARVWLISGQRLYLFDREENRDAFAASPERYLHDARARWPGLLATLSE